LPPSPVSERFTSGRGSRLRSLCVGRQPFVAVIRLDEDPALRERVGVVVRAEALTEFDERIGIEQTLGVFRELLGDGLG